MNHLFIVAHPDDEILGCAGTILELKKKHDRVAVAVFSFRSATRESDLVEKCKKTHADMGVDASYFFDYEMMKFDKYDRHQMTMDIESVILKERPDALYIHDINDIHNDHRTLHRICLEASKLPLRGISDAKPISAIYTFEVPSSSDWGTGFIPNAYCEVSEDDIRKKAEMLSGYGNVVRKPPHPVNYKNIMALAVYRGGQSGCLYAEAFRKIFERNKI